MKYNNRKGQVTVFIIIALVLVIGGVAYYSLSERKTGGLEPEIKISAEQSPLEFDPVREYVTDCLYSTASEGLILVGQQGGYVSLSDRNLNAESFAIGNNPTESDAVLFAAESDMAVPYWLYLKSSNKCESNCEFKSKRPELRGSQNSIEKQLERYIVEKIPECLGNFEGFEEQGYSIAKKGNAKSDVVIGADGISVVYEQKLDVDIQGAKSELKQFSTNIPVNLERIYSLATKISDLQAKHNFIEGHVLNLIAAFSGVSGDKLPPPSEIQFKLGAGTRWQKTDIKNKVTGLLSSYIPLFQVDGTSNYDRNLFGTELRQRLYDSTIIPLADNNYNDLSVDFSYLDFWSPYFNLNCKGESCMPSSANSLIQIFGIQDYRFFYDISFPVLIEIEDPTAFNDQGYSFMFFLEGNIRNNRPMKSDFVQLDANIPSEKSQLCDIRNSGDVKINVRDSSNNPVEGAQILFTVSGESCYIGTSGKDGVAVEKLPVAIGGVLTIQKDQYVGRNLEFSTSLDEHDSVDAKLSPVYTKKIVVKKKNVAKTPNGWEFVNSPLDLSEKESAFVSLIRVNDNGDNDFSSVSEFKGGQKETSLIELAPGTYDIDINLISKDKVVIPSKNKCEPIKILGVTVKKECYDIPAIDFSQGASAGEERFPAGGLKMQAVITPRDLENDVVTFYAVNFDLALVPESSREIEDADEITKIEEYSSTYQLALQPEFSK